MTMETQIPRFLVQVTDNLGHKWHANLEPANEKDLPDNWNFDWKGFWKRADFYCEAFIRLSYQGKVLGLVRFALYPAHTEDVDFKYLEILHVEAIPRRKRAINPVGFWLIWYACYIGLTCCPGDENGTLIRLDSTEAAMPYYENKVNMEPLGWTQIAPGEEGYAFRFTKEGAEAFCRRQQEFYGKPLLQAG